MTRGGLLAVVIAWSLAIAGCGPGGDEPAGLSTGTAEAGEGSESPTPTGEAGQHGGGHESEDTVPTAGETFAQPYLQSENIVELRDEVPIEVPDDATDAERAAVRGYGRYYAAWEQVLWGVPIEDSGIENTAAGERLEAVRTYAQESVERQRVSVGPPVSIHLLSVEVTGADATVDACVDSRNWVDSSADQPPEPDDPLYRFSVSLQDGDGRWLVTRAETDDDLEPCEGVFE